MIKSSQYRVSAMVSLYKAERFLEGRLSNLVEQTLFERGELQIVIVNSGSPENEGSIVRDFQGQFGHIRYLETSKRETLYKAWNRCIELSEGQYLTNANADDRLRDNAYEKLAIALDKNPSSGFAYGDAILSDKANENFDEVQDRSVYSIQDYFGPDLMLHQFLGHQAMWRRSLHDRVGPFDPSFKAAGDYEFFLRGASVSRATRVPECLGTLLRRSDSLTFSDGTMNAEVASIRNEFRTKDKLLKLFANEGIEFESEGMVETCLVEMGNRALCYYPQWGAGRPDADLDFAKICYDWAIDGRANGRKSEEAKRHAERNREIVEILSGRADGQRQISIACPDLKIPSTSSGIGRALQPWESLESSVSKGSTWRLRTGLLEHYWMMLLNLQDREIHRLAACSTGGRGFAIWGASSRGLFMARALLLKGIPVRFFIDNDKTKVGTELSGLPVCGVEELGSSRNENVKVLLACSGQQNRFIFAQLKNEGLESRLWRDSDSDE